MKKNYFTLSIGAALISALSACGGGSPTSQPIPGQNGYNGNSMYGGYGNNGAYINSVYNNGVAGSGNLEFSGFSRPVTAQPNSSGGAAASFMATPSLSNPARVQVVGQSLSGGQLCGFPVTTQGGSPKPVLGTNGQPIYQCVAMTSIPTPMMGNGMMMNGYQSSFSYGMQMNNGMMMNNGMPMNNGMMMNNGMAMNNGMPINNGMMMNQQMQPGFIFDFGAGTQFNGIAVVEQQFAQQMALHIQSQGSPPPYSFGRLR